MSARDDLIQYRFLLKEIEHLEEVIGELEVKKKEIMLSDMVEGSDSDYPYIKHKLRIRGLDFTMEEALDLNDQYDKLITKLREKKVQTHRTYVRALGYIYEAPDIVTRRALELRYIDGLSWMQVATKIGGVSPDAIRMSCAKYMKNYK